MTPEWWSAIAAVIGVALVLMNARDNRQQKDIDAARAEARREVATLRADTRREFDQVRAECSDLRNASAELAAVPQLLSQLRDQVNKMDEKIDRALDRRATPR